MGGSIGYFLELHIIPKVALHPPFPHWNLEMLVLQPCLSLKWRSQWKKLSLTTQLSSLLRESSGHKLKEIFLLCLLWLSHFITLKDIKMHILLTVLYTFLLELHVVGRICLNETLHGSFLMAKKVNAWACQNDMPNNSEWNDTQACEQCVNWHA